MKKFSFLIPVATAVAALTGQAQAKAPESVAAVDTSNTASTTAVERVASAATETLYVKNGELHSLMMKPSASGQMLAWHQSHQSHSSHSSHQSHYSHRSGY